MNRLRECLTRATTVYPVPVKACKCLNKLEYFVRNVQSTKLSRPRTTSIECTLHQVLGLVPWRLECGTLWERGASWRTPGGSSWRDRSPWRAASRSRARWPRPQTRSLRPAGCPCPRRSWTPIAQYTVRECSHVHMFTQSLPVLKQALHKVLEAKEEYEYEQLIKRRFIFVRDRCSWAGSNKTIRVRLYEYMLVAGGKTWEWGLGWEAGRTSMRPESGWNSRAGSSVVMRHWMANPLGAIDACVRPSSGSVWPSATRICVCTRSTLHAIRHANGSKVSLPKSNTTVSR